MKTSCSCILINVPSSDLPRVVVIGGGFGGISLVKALRNKPVQVVLIDRNNFHIFQPLLYQVTTCGIEPDNIAFPLRKMFSGYRNFFFRMAEVSGIIPEDNCIHTNIGDLQYDYLVIATGSTNNFFGNEQLKQFALGMKTIQESLNLRSLILQNLEKAIVTCEPVEKDALTNFVVAGGGPTGVETAGALSEFKRFILKKDYPEIDPSLFQVFLIEAQERLLPNMSEQSSGEVLKYLQKMGVKVLLETKVNSYDGKTVHISPDKKLIAKTFIWTAGVKGQYPPGLKPFGFLHTGRLRTDAFNKIPGHHGIFAIGDVASMEDDMKPNGHPMVAQVAIQQGRLLAANILNVMNGKTLLPFKYKDKGSVATVGRKRAVAETGRLKWKGLPAWYLWSFVHLFSISGFRNKILVGLNWAWNYLTYDMGNRLIIRKYSGEKDGETT